MPGLLHELPANERLILEINTSEFREAERLIAVTRSAGVCTVMLGLELSSATSWRECSALAADAEINWIADAKLDDTPDITAAVVRNLLALKHPPSGITVHCNSGVESLKAARSMADETGVTIFGVAQLASIGDQETRYFYHDLGRRNLVYRRVEMAEQARVGGIVCEARDLSSVRNLSKAAIALVTGTRPDWADMTGPENVPTPKDAILAGADLVLMGQPITADHDPAEACAKIVTQIEEGLHERRPK